jgi:hypothetical protein
MDPTGLFAPPSGADWISRTSAPEGRSLLELNSRVPGAEDVRSAALIVTGRVGIRTRWSVADAGGKKIVSMDPAGVFAPPSGADWISRTSTPEGGSLNCS